MNASGSVPFDRAVDFYDRTRQLPEELADAQTELLREQLTGRARCLEIGVGTGRIALPLARSGIALTGVDLSAPMLQRLLAKDSGAVPVAVADARRLPFGAATFDAVLACHVLHLVSAWTEVVDEALRVLRPGGSLLVSQGGKAGDETATELLRRLREAAGMPESVQRIGLRTLEELDLHLETRGIAVRRLPMLTYPVTRSVGYFLDLVAAQCYSWTWDMDETTLAHAVAEVRAWATAEWGDLTTAHMGSATVTWHAYDVPA